MSVMGASDTDDPDALMLPEDTRALGDIKPVLRGHSDSPHTVDARVPDSSLLKDVAVEH